MILTSEDYQEPDYRLSRPLGEIMQERALLLDERRKEPDKWRPIPTHLPALNAIIGGFSVEQPFYMLLFSSEKIGKTTIGMDLADAWRMGTKEPVLYIQLEELGIQYADRTIARMTSLTRSDIRMFNISDAQMQEVYEAAQARTQNDNLYIQDDLFSVFAFHTEAKRLGCKKIVIDNLQLTDQEGHKGASAQERFAAISKYLVKMRNQEGYSYVVISQESTTGKSAMSSQPERDADIRIKIKRAYETDSETEEEREVEGQRCLEVLPGRIGGTGLVYVTFDGNKNKIGPIVKKDINSNDFLEMVAAEGPNLRVEV